MKDTTLIEETVTFSRINIFADKLKDLGLNPELVEPISKLMQGAFDSGVSFGYERYENKPIPATIDLSLEERAKAYRVFNYGEDSILQMWDKELDACYTAGYTDHAQQSKDKYVGIVEAEILKCKNEVILNYTFDYTPIIKVLTNLLTKFKDS